MKTDTNMTFEQFTSAAEFRAYCEANGLDVPTQFLIMTRNDSEAFVAARNAPVQAPAVDSAKPDQVEAALQEVEALVSQAVRHERRAAGPTFTATMDQADALRRRAEDLQYSVFVAVGSPRVMPGDCVNAAIRKAAGL